MPIREKLKITRLNKFGAIRYIIIVYYIHIFLSILYSWNIELGFDWDRLLKIQK